VYEDLRARLTCALDKREGQILQLCLNSKQHTDASEARKAGGRDHEIEAIGVRSRSALGDVSQEARAVRYLVNTEAISPQVAGNEFAEDWIAFRDDDSRRNRYGGRDAGGVMSFGHFYSRNAPMAFPSHWSCQRHFALTL
jgi:hypothetical protein